MENRQIAITEFGGVENLVLQTSAIPEPKAGEVVVKVAMAGLVGPHVRHHVPEGGIRSQLVVLHGLGRCWHRLPVLEVTLVDLL